MFEQKTGNSSQGTSAASKVKNALTLERAGKYESALMSLEEALSLQENYTDAWLIKGVILGKLGKYSEAIKCYDKVIDLDSFSADAWHLKGALHSASNMHEKAVECYRKAIEMDPTNLDYRLSAASCFQKLKRFDEAVQCYQKAKLQRPNDAEIDYLIGIMNGNMGDYEKALVSFEIALRLRPDFTDALLGKALMLAKLGRKDEAKQCANQMLQIKDCQTQEKQAPAQPISLNDSIREEFASAQRRFREAYSHPNKCGNK